MAAITTISNQPSTGTRAVINAASGTGTSQTEDAKKKADELQNQFLSILLTQMQNQNPLDPMDTKEFTGQLAQFSSLEQQIDTNTKLETLLSTIQTNSTSSAFSYIGKEADIESSMTAYQNNQADWSYSVDKDAKSVKLKVVDAKGNVLYQTTDDAVQAGTYNFKVDAADLVPPPAAGSVLTLKVDAVDTDGKTVAATIKTTVLIDGIESGENGVDMRAGNLLFGMSDIKKVRTPQNA